MRTIAMFLLLSALVMAQASPTVHPTSATTSSSAGPNELIVPAGTKVPLALKHAVSTKSAREGDSVYAETTFPVVQDNRVLIPAGTYVQGRISHVQRAGRIKGRAEVLMHFTTLIYPSGYTVMLPGAVENVPGAEKTSIKGQEGTIRQDSQKGEKIGTVASSAGTGAVIGGLSRGGKGAAIGAGIGGAVGTAIALLSRGNDVKLDAGTTVEMVFQRAVPLDPSRIPPPVK
jgi:type IV secretory pathway VirB10-like protein